MRNLEKTPLALLLLLSLGALATGARADFRSGSRTSTIGGSLLGAELTMYAGVENAPPATNYLGASNYLAGNVLLDGNRYEAVYVGAYAWVRPGNSSCDFVVRLAGHQVSSAANKSSLRLLPRPPAEIVLEGYSIEIIPLLLSVEISAGASCQLPTADLTMTSQSNKALVDENLRTYASVTVSGGVSVLGIASAGISATGIFFDTEFDSNISASSTSLGGNTWFEFRPVRLVLSFWWELDLLFWTEGDTYVIGDFTWVAYRRTIDLNKEPAPVEHVEPTPAPGGWQP